MRETLLPLSKMDTSLAFSLEGCNHCGNKQTALMIPLVIKTNARASCLRQRLPASGSTYSKRCSAAAYPPYPRLATPKAAIVLGRLQPTPPIRLTTVSPVCSAMMPAQKKRVTLRRE